MFLGTALIRIMQAFSSFGTGPYHYFVIHLMLMNMTLVCNDEMPILIFRGYDLKDVLKHYILQSSELGFLYHKISGCLEHLRRSEAM